LLFCYSFRPVEDEVGAKLPRAPRRLGALPSLKNIKYTRMRILKRKKFNFFQTGPTRMFGAGGENVFPGPAVALDGLVFVYSLAVLV